MNGSLNLFVDIFALSGGFWLIYGFFNIYRIRSFVVERYERETDLLNTVFFREHATFTRYLPTFFSSALYAGHLLLCLWGWRIYGKRKVFRDIEAPEVIIQHFSKKEIGKLNIYGISLILVILHFFAYFIFSYIWPDIFG